MIVLQVPPRRFAQRFGGQGGTQVGGAESACAAAPVESRCVVRTRAFAGDAMIVVGVVGELSQNTSPSEGQKEYD